VSEQAILQLDASAPDRLVLAGALSFGNAATALARLRASLQERAATGLDLSGITTADSAGLAVLLALASDARTQRRSLQFQGVPNSLRALAQLCDVTGLLGFEPA
jgi:phospholipid transport system transporter-binding protein